MLSKIAFLQVYMFLSAGHGFMFANVLKLRVRLVVIADFAVLVCVCVFCSWRS